MALFDLSATPKGRKYGISFEWKKNSFVKEQPSKFLKSTFFEVNFKKKFHYTAEDFKFIKTNLVPSFQTMRIISLKKASPAGWAISPV